MPRKALSDSLRWTVFARDGFTCRYCGKQAGQEGVTLACDHLLSVADGGDNRIDNLVTACKDCNGGKGARSLSAAPTTKEVQERIASSTAAHAEQAKAIVAAMQSEKELEQEIVNMKCAAYGRKSVRFDRSEMTIAKRLCREFGADILLGWYERADGQCVPEQRAIKYVCGCARNARAERPVA